MTRLRPVRVLGLAAGCVWLAAGGPAMAFFPPLPIGTGPVTVIPPPSLPSAPDGNLTPVPPVPAPPFTPPPTRVVIPQDIPNPPRPEVVPEPASVVSALAGLAAVGAAVRRRRPSVRTPKR